MGHESGERSDVESYKRLLTFIWLLAAASPDKVDSAEVWWA
jgi:hypothetical protein